MPAKRRRMKGGARLLQLAKKSRIAAQDRRKKSAGKPVLGRAGNVTPLPKKSAGTPVVKKKVVGNSPRGLPGVSVNVSPSRRPPSRRPVSGKRVSINASSPRKPASSRVKKAVGSSSKKKRITIDPSKMPWYTPTTSTTPTKAKTPAKPTKPPTKPPAKPKPKVTKKAKQPDPARKTSATERPYISSKGVPAFVKEAKRLHNFEKNKSTKSGKPWYLDLTPFQKDLLEFAGHAIPGGVAVKLLNKVRKLGKTTDNTFAEIKQKIEAAKKAKEAAEEAAKKKRLIAAKEAAEKKRIAAEKAAKRRAAAEKKRKESERLFRDRNKGEIY